MLRTLMTVLVAVLFSTATMAQEILVIKAGSKSGSSAQRNNIYAEVLKEQGYTVNLTKNMHNDLAIDMYNKAEGPAVLVWIDMLAGKYDVEYSAKEFMGIEYTVPLFMCQINAKADKATGITAIQRNAPKGVISELGYKNQVPYASSTKVLNAAIAGEVDFAYTSQSGKKKLGELGKTCEAIPGLNYNAYTIAKNVDSDKFRSVIKTIIESPQMKKWQEGRGYTNASATWNYDKDLAFVKEAMATWSSARKAN